MVMFVCSLVVQVGTDTECSTDSVLIEAEYQRNPRGSMNFTVNGQSYLLDFTGASHHSTDQIHVLDKFRPVLEGKKHHI